MDKNRTEALRHIRALSDTRKQEIQTYYAALKLGIASTLKTLTLNDLRQAGATITPTHIILSRVTTDKIIAHGRGARKREEMVEKFNEIKEDRQRQVVSYYLNLKQQLPSILLKKSVSELNDDDLELLGIDINWYTKITKAAGDDKLQLEN